MLTSRSSSHVACLFSGICWLMMVVCGLPTLQAEIVVREDVNQIQIETPHLQAAIRKNGYVSGVAAGSLLDKKTGFRDVGFGLDIADWIMEEPFVMSDEFVSIDREQSTYRPGEKATIRVRVKDSDGKPLIDKEKKVEAVISRDGKEVANVLLQSDGKSGGLFLGETPVLESGEHEMSVRVPELYKNNELKNHVKFYVEEPAVPDELTKLNCNESLLREIAERSDGSYLKEEQMGLLNELLKPISSGRVVKSEIALWQSYWWFTPIVLLLGLELFLRKRAGML